MSRALIIISLIISLVLPCISVAASPDECIALRNSGKYREAVRAGEDAVAMDRGNMSAWYCLGDSWALMGSVRPAVSSLANALKVAQKDYDKMKIYYRIGEILNNVAGEEMAALEAWTQCTALAVKTEDTKVRILAMQQRAILLDKTGKIDQSISEYITLGDLLKGDNRHPVVLNNLAALYIKKKQYGKAADVLGQAVQEDRKAGNKLNLYYHQASLGYTYLQAGNKRPAYSLLTEIYQSATTDKYKDARFWVMINHYMSEMYLAIGDYKKAKLHAAEAAKFQLEEKPLINPPKEGITKHVESKRR